MAKASAADKKQKSQPAANEPDVEAALEEAIIASVDEAANESLAESATLPAPVAASDFDIAGLTRAGSDIQNHLRALAQSVEGASQGWEGLNGQIQRANDEITRLKAAELDRARLIEQLDDRAAVIVRLETELKEAKANITAANERTTKLEEVVEGIKERALELHTSLQEARTKEEKYVADIESVRVQLADLGRQAQDEGVARVAAEERAKKLEADYKRLEADELAARDRIAKLMEDNKTMAAQVPQLLIDRERWQKQLSASERENARLVAERQTMTARIADFEEEVRTLRADLSSLTAAPSAVGFAAAPAAVAPASAAASASSSASSSSSSNGSQAPEEKRESEDVVDDDLDLEASLERVFAQDMANFTDKDAKH